MSGSSRLAALMLGIGACSFTPPAAPSDGGDDTSTTIGFETSSSSADEASGTLMIPVVLSAPTDAPVTVSYARTDGTATPGVDFVISSSSLTVAAGQTQAEIPISILGDGDEAESDETIVVTLSAPSGATLAATTTHTITISNTLLPRVEFAVVTSSTSEPTQTMALVMLDKPASAVTTVQLGVSGTATPGVDFAVANQQTVTFAAGETSQMVAIGEVNDTLDEDPETVVLQLDNPSPEILVGTRSTLTHTIVDEDSPPTVSFTAASSSVTEGTATVTLTAALSTASGLTVTAPFAAATGTTASTPGDFTFSTASPLSFAPGTLTQTITITIANDAIGEVDELLNVALGTPTNATLGTIPTHLLTIVDDDCLGRGAFRVCPTTAPTGTTVLGGSLNTDTDPRCATTQPAGWTAGNQPASCFVIAANVNVNGGGLRVAGSRPLVVFATGAITISAGLDAAAQGTADGPGGPSAACKAFAGAGPQNNSNGGGAGAGASFMSKGGDGAGGDGGNVKGGNAPTADASDPTILRGGCRGQDGGNGSGAGGGGAGGLGGGAGGAVYLVAGTISISGSINVSGGGGDGGAADAGGGGGAGAGGMILLDAATLSANGTLLANGGGGGQGADSNSNGGPGADPSAGAPTSPALGGNAGGAGGAGGNGSAGATAATAGTDGGGGKGGGAGGGGGGFIKGSSALAGTVSAGKIVP
ncbi:MAG: Calx-beta domain protein [Deltaproteobacteria bacterium]|nr:Calx-beta domain protein [Deltaproteobacteria bacterium]